GDHEPPRLGPPRRGSAPGRQRRVPVPPGGYDTEPHQADLGVGDMGTIPMYVGMAALYVGGTLLLNDPWPLAFLPIVITLVQWRVIAREEAYLERRFGDEYRTYKARVRRWI